MWKRPHRTRQNYRQNCIIVRRTCRPVSLAPRILSLFSITYHIGRAYFGTTRQIPRGLEVIYLKFTLVQPCGSIRIGPPAQLPLPHLPSSPLPPLSLLFILSEQKRAPPPAEPLIFPKVPHNARDPNRLLRSIKTLRPFPPRGRNQFSSRTQNGPDTSMGVLIKSDRAHGDPRVCPPPPLEYLGLYRLELNFGRTLCLIVTTPRSGWFSSGTCANEPFW